MGCMSLLGVEDDIDHEPFKDLHDKSYLVELIVNEIEKDIKHFHKAIV